jgi:hypothetical protein
MDLHAPVGDDSLDGGSNDAVLAHSVPPPNCRELGPSWIERRGSNRGIEILSYLAVELAMGARVVGHFLDRVQDCRPDGGQASHDGWRNSIYDVMQSGGGLFLRG